MAPDADSTTVREDLAARLPDARGADAGRVPQAQPRLLAVPDRRRRGADRRRALGIIVGVVIVAQTLYSSTKDHLNEFATLRALGASAGYIQKVILIQAMLSALIGYASA